MKCIYSIGMFMMFLSLYTYETLPLTKFSASGRFSYFVDCIVQEEGKDEKRCASAGFGDSVDILFASIKSFFSSYQSFPFTKEKILIFAIRAASEKDQKIAPEVRQYVTELMSKRGIAVTLIPYFSTKEKEIVQVFRTRETSRSGESISCTYRWKMGERGGIVNMGDECPELKD